MATGLSTRPEYSPQATAVSLGIALLKKAKANTWAELMLAAEQETEEVIKGVQAYDLTDEQYSLLQEYQQYVNLIKVSPSVIPTFCDTCDTVNLLSGGLQKRCINTRGCNGSMYKPAAATVDK